MTCNVIRGEKDRALGRRYKVIADGKDVTDGTFYVDARRRIVRVYARNAKGDFYIDYAAGTMVTKTLRPRRVRLVPRKKNRQ